MNYRDMNAHGQGVSTENGFLFIKRCFCRESAAVSEPGGRVSGEYFRPGRWAGYLSGHW